jgi:TonB family protein
LPDFGHHLKVCVSRNAWLIGCALHLTLTANVAYGQSGAQSATVGTRTLPAGYVVFDIPAQSLISALETYSTITGREILYNGKLVVDRRSAAIDGAYTPQVALSMLLEGTGLSPRYMANDALMLQAVPRSMPRNLAANTAPSTVVARYYGRVQSRLKTAFCVDDRTQPGEYHVAVSFWIGATGLVSDVELLGSTGEAARDAMIDRTLRTLAIDAPPPPGFAQPVTLVVAPWSVGMTHACQAVSTEAQSSRVVQ